MSIFYWYVYVLVVCLCPAGLSMFYWYVSILLLFLCPIRKSKFYCFFLNSTSMPMSYRFFSILLVCVYPNGMSILMVCLCPTGMSTLFWYVNILLLCHVIYPTYVVDMEQKPCVYSLHHCIWLLISVWLQHWRVESTW